MITRKQKIALIFFSLWPSHGHAMNLLLRPYDTLLRPEIYGGYKGEVSLWAESGVRPAQGFNDDGDRVNIFHILDRDQDALAMLNGFGDESSITQLRNALDASDDGVRGHLLFDGKMNLDFGGAVGGRWYFLPHTWLTAYLPFYKVRLRDVTITDLTENNTSADFRVKNILTDRLNDVVNEFGNGLDLGGWKRTGPGDMNLLVEFLLNFPQARPMLKNVEVGGRAGLTLPTGLKANEDKLLAFPFGYDGAVGIVYGGGLECSFGQLL